MRFIGDVHGKIDEYIALAGQVPESIQVGDMGVGFPEKMHIAADKLLRDFQDTGKHGFIRGNHDNPSTCIEFPGWIPDGFFDPSRSIMYIGGAFSIDHASRTMGHDLWPDEELSYPELDGLITQFAKNKPKIVVSHDCPELIATDMFFAEGTMWRPQIHTRTGAALEMMFQAHEPVVWIFGHWHKSKHYKKPRTRTTFICLDELDFIDINI